MSLTATTSRTDAHRIFANLYKKKRSPEHQRKIDEILTRSNDVFIRIDLIKRLDKEFEEKEKKNKTVWFEPPRKDQTSKIKVKKDTAKQQEPESKEKEKKEASGGEEQIFFGEVENEASTAEDKALTRPKREGYDFSKEKTSSRELARVTGEKLPALKGAHQQSLIAYMVDLVRKFFQRVLGVNESIARFAEETGALHYPMLSRSPELSPGVKKIFDAIQESEIEDTLKALEFCEQYGWKEWDTSTYNTIVNFHRFVYHFRESRNKFHDGETPRSFLLQTKRMQMYYARHLKRKHGDDIILKKIPEFVKRDQQFAAKIRQIYLTLKKLCALEDGQPRFTEVIIGLYVLEHDKIVYWKQIESALRVPPIDDSQFEGSNQIIDQIKGTVENLEKDLRERITTQDEKDLIRKKYFQFNDSGKVVCGFLNSVVNDFIQNYYYSEEGHESLRWKFKNYPHWLFLLVCRDLRNIYAPLLSDYVAVEDTYIKNILITNKNLFMNDLEKLDICLGQIEDFHRSYPEFALTFDKMNTSYMNSAMDRAEVQFFKLIADAADLFGRMARKLHSILNNHRMALEIEERNKLTSEIKETAQAAITDTKNRARYIPYYSGKMVCGNRLNHKTVESAIHELTTYLFNYAVIFKNSTIIGMVASKSKSETELGHLKREYKRLSGETFRYKSIWSLDKSLDS